MSRVVGQQDDCVQCGESREAIKESQRKGGQHVLFCAIVDSYDGECTMDWDRHRFIWTHKDQAAQEAHDAHWDRMIAAIEAEEAEAKS